MIKFITDSASDIPFEYEKELDIEVMPVPITVGGNGYYERRDFTQDEFYKILNEEEEIPTTSHINMLQFGEKYNEFYKAGYDEIIHVTISSTGSAMFEAAQMAREMFYKQDESLRSKVKIHVIDSKTYSYGYGFAVVQGARMAREGKSAEEILEYMRDYFSRVEVYFSTASLRHAKKSGRIGVAATFVGEMLGLRPVISIIDGKMNIIDKVRGNKQMSAKLAQILSEKIDESSDSYNILLGTLESEKDDLKAELQSVKDKKLADVVKIGACIAINAGTDAIGVAFLGKKRS